MLIGDLLRRAAKRYPDKVAWVCGADRCAYGQLNDRVNRLANALLSRGVHKGDRVAVLADTCPQYLEIYFAGAKTGIVITPLGTTLDKSGISYIINNTEANTLILGNRYREVIRPITGELETVRNFITIGGDSEEPDSYEALISTSSPEEPKAELEEEDLLYVCYTSGTTGLPKGVMYTHRNLLASTTEGIIMFGVAHDDVALLILPSFHPAFPWMAISKIRLGATMVAMQSFDPQLALRTVEKEKVTTIDTSTSMVASFVEVPDIHKYDVSSLRWVSCAGSPLPVASLKKALKSFGNIFINYYAQAESTGPVALLLPKDIFLEGPENKVRQLGSCGREAIDTEVRVVDEAGNDVAPGEVAELIVKSDGMAKGYWNLPQVTAETIKGGYLYTGDLATRDEEGYIYITGRKQDMINSQGHKVYAREIEEVLYHHPAILEAAVIGIPEKKIGESIKAVVITKEGMVATEKEIIEFCGQSLPSYAVPASIEFVGKLPRNPMGKVMKRFLHQ